VSDRHKQGGAGGATADGVRRIRAVADLAPEFLVAARAFRAALASEEVEPHEFARRVRNGLARVYLAAALLPASTPQTDDAPPSQRDRRGSDTLRDRLRTRFGGADRFVDVFDPAGIDGDDSRPIERSLAQELVEIDDDLAEAVSWLEGGVADALWEVRERFEIHWGKHAVDVLRPLHGLARYGVV
jgi:hypothetical protein